mgnify:FL=1
MKPGDLFNAKIGAVCVTVSEIKGNPPQLRWMVTHHERIKGNAVRGVAFYGPTRSAAIDELIKSKRRLPQDLMMNFE